MPDELKRLGQGISQKQFAVKSKIFQQSVENFRLVTSPDTDDGQIFQLKDE